MLPPAARFSALAAACASLAALALAPAASVAFAAEDPLLLTYRRDIEPILAKHCFDCHGNGVDKGGVRLDEFTSAAALRDHKLWSRALRNVRAGLMPPADEPPLPAADAAKLSAWIKQDAFGLDPAAPDPGRVTVRRLNRVEYRNTIRELTGVDFDTQKEFPADDTGHGFDNMADVLSISPLLLEKYLDAAQTIVAQAVPVVARVVAERNVPGRAFATVAVDTVVPPAAEVAPAAPAATPPPGRPDRAQKTAPPPPPARRPAPAVADGDALELSYYTPATVTAPVTVAHAGRYAVTFDLRTVERYVEDQFDLNRARVTLLIDGEPVRTQEFAREGSKKFTFDFDRTWTAGEHTLSVRVEPLEPFRPQIRQLRLRLTGVTLRGPHDPAHYVKPAGYDKIFPRDPPADAAARRAYARELLERFASRAFRRPVDAAVLDRLVDLAERTSAAPRATFEAGVAQAMVAVLASPSFLFRDERTLPLRPGQKHPELDEYSLASRLSYFLWSTMPDAELLRLAAAGQLRAKLPDQLKRLLADPRSREFVKNFTGQWLHARDVPNIALVAQDIFLRDHPQPHLEEAQATFRRLRGKPRDQRTPEENAAMDKARAAFAEFNRVPKPDFTPELRRAMAEETELTFAHLVKEDRSLLELLDADYTFLNEALAKHYGIEGVSGRQMRKVQLPPGSPRGGVLTQGTVLAVTSNPTRTSPVKRGVFILESILGTPPAPPPPDIPSLEESVSAEKLRNLSLRDSLELHAKNPLCSSCHSRMDPLGLALENFNALGVWRTTELGQPVQPAGKLATGETFADIRELKRVLATSRRHDFYHCMAEKLLTYALGRGLDYYDTTTLDALAAQLEATGGKPSALLLGIVTSAPFQQRRATPTSLASHP